jgi:O-acetyl-ADP-ribose deacetylase (regulator of RNase III)
MAGHVFISQGDITQLSADAIAFSAANALLSNGNLYSSFDANVPGFREWYAGLRRREGGALPIGATFWMPLGDRKPHGVVVVVSTGFDKVADKAGVAVRNAIDAAVRELRAAGRRGRLLVALPAFRVGMGGDHHQRLASARAQVQAARAALEQYAEVDVAFLTYTPALYRIFLEARRSVGAAPDLPAVPELERAIRDGACVLFVGAGLSAGAGLPGWNELIGRMARDLQIAPSPALDNLDLAQWYREQFGNDRLGDVLRATFAGGGLPTLPHYLLMALPVRHVITTNYDHLLERSLRALKRHPMPVVRQEDVAHTGGAGVYVVKLHGDAEHPADIVLSRDDYHAFFEKRPAMALLLEGLLLNQTFFFVGYSLRDPNFRQVFSRIARMLPASRRPAFATSFEARGDTSDYVRRQWQRQQLRLIPIDGETTEQRSRAFLLFLDALAERVIMRSPPLVLAADVPTPAGVGRLREILEAAGDEVQRLCADGAAEEDVRFLAKVVDFLTEHGWRPARMKPLCRLYEDLAEHAGDAEQRRRLLVAALGAAETFADAARLREMLEEKRG